MILENSTITADIVSVDPIAGYLTLAFIVVCSILMYLIVKSADEVSVEETEKNADEFAGIIKENHGPVTTWLWAVYIAMIVWAIAYLIQHGAEFVNFP